MTNTIIELVDWLEDRELTALEKAELLIRCLAMLINAGSSTVKLEEHISVFTQVLAEAIRDYQQEPVLN